IQHRGRETWRAGPELNDRREVWSARSAGAGGVFIRSKEPFTRLSRAERFFERAVVYDVRPGVYLAAVGLRWLGRRDFRRRRSEAPGTILAHHPDRGDACGHWDLSAC